MRFADDKGYYELNPFPGCNQLVVSNHACIYQGWRGRGFGKKQHAERLAMAIKLGYDAIICTVNAENLAEKAILKDRNWKKLMEFTNLETGNLIEIWGKAFLE